MHMACMPMHVGMYEMVLSRVRAMICMCQLVDLWGCVGAKQRLWLRGSGCWQRRLMTFVQPRLVVCVRICLNQCGDAYFWCSLAMLCTPVSFVITDETCLIGASAASRQKI